MEYPYIIKIKNGNVEFEISGTDKDFVSEKYKEILNDIQSMGLFEIDTQCHEQVLRQPIDNASAIHISSQDTISETEKFADSAGVTLDELLNVYDFNNGDIYIHRDVKGSDAEKQKKITKLALIANEYIIGKNDLSGKALGKYMTELAVGSMSNLAANLKREKGIIKIKNRYRLNAIGKREAFDLIKELVQI